MTRRIFSAIASSVFIVSIAAAQTDTGFPFEGEITGNDVNVRSGEGTQYYATTQLKSGDRVVVLGASNGWYRILPPTGSFSYIDKSAVERHTSGIGSVSRDKAYVRAGSHISRRKSRTQVIVEKGEPVVILGEVDGFYKIEPPKRATLYISPEFVKRVPAGQESALMRQYNAADWKTAPPADAEPGAKSDAVAEPPTRASTPPTPPRKTFVSPSENRAADRAPIVVDAPISANARAPEPDPFRVRNAPVRRSTGDGDVLVLGPSGRARGTHTSGPAPSNRDLTPADRRPPARIPDWADTEREADSGDTYTITNSSDAPPSESAERAAIVSEPGFSSSGGARRTMGTMQEVGSTPSVAPVAANTPAAANDSVPSYDSTVIVQQTSSNTPARRSDSGDTLTLNATDATTPAAPSTSETVRTARITTESTFEAASPPDARDTFASSDTAADATVIPPAPTPPPQVPVDPNSGPYAANLVAVEGDLHAVMFMPVEKRPYNMLIQRYQEIAVQSDEFVPAEYARIRVEQLQNLERIRRLAVRYASDHDGLQQFSRRMEQERTEIRQANQQARQVGAFDYEGELMRSYAFAPEKRRYRLVDPGTQSTIIYVDIPQAVAANPDALTGHRVGVRIGTRQYSDAAQIPIVEAAAIVDLTAPPTKFDTIPAETGRNSLGISNPGNTPASDPNSLMNPPDRREPAEPGTMREMTAIAS